MILIKEGNHQILPLRQEDCQRHKPDNGQLQCVFGRDRENVAHGNGLDRNRHWVDRYDEQAKPEERCEYQANDYIDLQTGSFRQEQHRASGQSTGNKCT